MPTTPMDSAVEQARHNMIEQQIRPWEVLDAEVLQVLARVPRELFVPPAHRALAFADMDIPLRGTLQQAWQSGECMLAPKVEARLLQDLALPATARVLEVGAGSGHMAALLAAKAPEGLVWTLEIEPDLAAMARANLGRAGIRNAEVREGDGSAGLSALAPFDAIVLSGSVAEIPQPLLAQLAIGGRLAAIVGDEPVMRATIVTRTAEDAWSTAQPWDTLAPRLRGFSEPARFHF